MAVEGRRVTSLSVTTRPRCHPRCPDLAGGGVACQFCPRRRLPPSAPPSRLGCGGAAANSPPAAGSRRRLPPHEV